ncbi:hypothetical protein A8E76_08685, partial [Burkholderia cenocepacia]
MGPADFNNNVNMTNHRITGLAAGTAGTDAVNLNQLNSAIASAATASNPYVRINSTATGANAATTNSIAIGPNASVTTGGVTGANSSIAIGNGAAAGGTDSIMIGTNARHAGSGATVLGANASAMGGGAGVAFGYGSSAAGTAGVALGSSSQASGRNSVALGTGSIANADNTVSVGSTTTQRRITNLAAGTANTDAVNVGQLNTAISNAANPYVAARGTTAANATGASSIAIGDGAIARNTATAAGQTNIAIGARANTSGGFGQLALGDGASTQNAAAGGAIAIGRGATTTQRGVALGDGASVTAQFGVALGDGSLANQQNTVSVGNATTQRRIVNLAAGTGATDAVNVSQLTGVTKALGGGAAVGANGSITNPTYNVGGTDYHNVGDALDALAASGIGNPNAVIYDDATKSTVTLGGTAATAPVALKNVADAKDDHDALNLGQLKNAGLVGDDGAGNLTSLAVTYDDATKDTATLAGASGTTLSNVKAGVADMDAVNVSQLKGSGLIGDDGKSIAAVTYDRNADGTPNYGTVTLGNGTGPTQVKNVADATDDHDALNLGQLKDAGLVGDDGAGNLTSLAVTYDDATKTAVTLGDGATPVAIHNVADGVLAADSKDAVNGSQLFATNTRVGDLEDSLGKGGVIDPVTGESLAVVYDSNTKDTVTLAGASGTTLSNVKAGVADMDAVNVSQLKGSGLIGDDGKSIAAVTYDRNADGTPNYGTVTLGNGAGPTQVKNVADATDDHDALNLGQLKDAGLVGDDGSGNLTSLAVTYDGTTKDSVTLGGVGATAPVALHNVADGVLSATSKDAVNGSQLFATNTRVGDLEDSLGKGGVIDPVTGESLAVVYDSNVKDTVTLAGTNGTTLSNVKAGVADMDAVNVSQLKDSGLIDPSTGKSIAAVTYDRNPDGTPNYGTVTLGNGAGPTQIKNVATGVDDLDAVNVKQLNTGLSDLEDRMSGGNLRFVKVNADPFTGTPAVASGALAVAIGSDARATSANSLALGSGARVTGNGSVAIGYNSVANQNNVVSVGDVGRERKVVNVADGDVAFQSTDAVNGGQLYAALNTLSTSVTSKTQQAIDTFSSELDKKTKAAIDEVSARSMQPMDVSDPLVAIEGLQGNNVASLNGADPTKATAAAIGSSTAASGANAVAVGLQSGAGSNNSVAIGSFAQTGAGQDYSVAVGSNVQTNGTQAVALGANAQANGEYALAVGNNGAQAIGDGSIAVGNAANVRAGATNAVAIGTGANVARSVEGAMALGANATAGAANSIALGANAFSDRANALSVGRAGAERQIVNVAAGTQTTDAVNVGQLKGVTDSLGGGSTVGADGKVTNPTYSLADPADASKSVAYNNVGDALSNLDGRTVTNTQNITVINKQLADSGLVDPVTGQSIAAVTYDRNTDGTPNMGSVTLGGAGATAPVALKNVADGTDRHDAINLGQLQDAGLVAPVDPTNPGAGLTTLAVTYDGTAKDVVTLAGAGGTTLSNVKAGVADMDAVNVSQLKDSGLIDPSTGKAIAAVTYDRNADGTPNYGSVTLGNGTGPTQLKNVADATDDGDALNLGQLKDAGLVGDDGSGNLTSMAVTYDGTAKDSVTLGGTGATTPVALHNVADGVLAADSKDAVNGSQLFATNQNLGDLKDSLEKGGVIDPTTGESLAVVYDGAAKNSVTLGNAGVPVAIHNVAAGAVNATSHDAVNGSQLFTVSQSVADKIGGGAGVGADGSITDPTYSVGGQDYHNVGDALGALDKNSGGNPLAVAYDSAAKDTVTLGGAGAPTPVALKNVADAKDDGDALNLGQLKNAGLVGDDGAGNLTSMA